MPVSSPEQYKDNLCGNVKETNKIQWNPGLAECSLQKINNGHTSLEYFSKHNSVTNSFATDMLERTNLFVVQKVMQANNYHKMWSNIIGG